MCVGSTKCTQNSKRYQAPSASRFAEYQWPIFRALDGALFYDAGTVASSAQALSMRHAHTDYGAGVRLHSTTRTLVRLDLARSREGNRVIFSFTAPFGASSHSVVPYVP